MRVKAIRVVFRSYECPLNSALQFLIILSPFLENGVALYPFEEDQCILALMELSQVATHRMYPVNEEGRGM